jgi:hypothetical protein
MLIHFARAGACLGFERDHACLAGRGVELARTLAGVRSSGEVTDAPLRSMKTVVPRNVHTGRPMAANRRLCRSSSRQVASRLEARRNLQSPVRPTNMAKLHFARGRVHSRVLLGR